MQEGQRLGEEVRGFISNKLHSLESVGGKAGVWAGPGSWDVGAWPLDPIQVNLKAWFCPGPGLVLESKSQVDFAWRLSVGWSLYR